MTHYSTPTTASRPRPPAEPSCAAQLAACHSHDRQTCARGVSHRISFHGCGLLGKQVPAIRDHKISHNIYTRFMIFLFPPPLFSYFMFPASSHLVPDVYGLGFVTLNSLQSLHTNSIPIYLGTTAVAHQPVIFRYTPWIGLHGCVICVVRVRIMGCNRSSVGGLLECVRSIE